MDCIIFVAKTNPLISYAVVTLQLTYDFVFANAKAGFLMTRLKCWATFSTILYRHCTCVNLYVAIANSITALRERRLRHYTNISTIFMKLLQHMRQLDSLVFVMVCQGESNVHPQMRLVMRKPAFCICENKDADQLRGNREADQHLCFRYTDSTIPLLPKFEISSL